jgi:hypothetical protein
MKNDNSGYSAVASRRFARPRRPCTKGVQKTGFAAYRAVNPALKRLNRKAVRQTMAFKKPLWKTNRAQIFLPQICHKPKRADEDNGGFLRVSEDPCFVAKTPPKGYFLSVTVC